MFTPENVASGPVVTAPRTLLQSAPALRFELITLRTYYL